MEKGRLGEKPACQSEAIQRLPKLHPEPSEERETELALKKGLCAVTAAFGNLLLLQTETDF